jgi:hypothetical protein
LHKELWQQLTELKGVKVAASAQCQYSKNPGEYNILFLNEEYTVDVADKKILSSTGQEAEFIEQLCILSYLINAVDVPEAGKLVKGDSLAGGEFFFKGVHALETARLEECFGECPDLLFDIAESFDAIRCDFGDASIKLYAFSRIPLTIVIWQSDDEFPARASILFDKTANKQLPLDALLAVANYTIKSLVAAAG